MRAMKNPSMETLILKFSDLRVHHLLNILMAHQLIVIKLIFKGLLDGNQF